MSAATRSKSTAWHKEHYEKIAVVAVLIVLLGSSLFLLVQNREAQRALEEARWEQVDAGRGEYVPVDLGVFQPYLARLEAPDLLTLRDQLTLVSDLRIVSANPDVRTPIPYDAETCPWTGYEQPTMADRDTTGDGIPDEWLTGFGLDPFDVTLADRDVDGDGFTVREEYEAGTSPIDPEDHPSHALKLRVGRVREIPFGIRFQGVVEFIEGDIQFQLNRRDGQTVLRRMGDTIDGYRIIEHERRTRRGSRGGVVDASILRLQREDGREIELVANVDHRVEERVAELIFTVDDSVFRVREGGEFEVRGSTFLVLDVQLESVQLRDIERMEEVTVTREAPLGAAPREGDEGGRAPAEADVDFDALFGS